MGLGVGRTLIQIPVLTLTGCEYRTRDLIAFSLYVLLCKMGTRGVPNHFGQEGEGGGGDHVSSAWDMAGSSKVTILFHIKTKTKKVRIWKYLRGPENS